jgi:hypothetical protein
MDRQKDKARGKKEAPVTVEKRKRGRPRTKPDAVGGKGKTQGKPPLGQE